MQESINQINPEVAGRLIKNNEATFLDIRSARDFKNDSIVGARHLEVGQLQTFVNEADKTRPVVVYCQHGLDSIGAARYLQEQGFKEVYSLQGGLANLRDTTRLDPLRQERYGRHILIPEIGSQGQKKLLASKVLVVGAGGLGSPASFYLAAAGVGNLKIIDDDRVERSNLQRQILHTEHSIGKPKVVSAKERLNALNPDVSVECIEERLTKNNVEAIFSDVDVVLDGTDNFATRYLINDACVKLGIANVHGSVYRFEGQVSIFWPAKGGPCYRCLFPSPPPPELAPSCAEAGVLGVLPGVIGTLQAVETIKILLNLGEPLLGRLIVYDALKCNFNTLSLKSDPNCPLCPSGKPFPGYIDYEAFCRSSESPPSGVQ